MALFVRLFNHIAAKFVAAPRLTLSQKGKKQDNLKASLKNILSILRRGYYIVTKDGRTQHVRINSAERQFLLGKAAKLRVGIKVTGEEIKDYTSTFKSRSTKAKNAYNEDLKILREKARLKKESRKVVNKVEQIVTEASFSNFPTLAEYVAADVNSTVDYKNLMDFFSQNLAGEYSKFGSDAELTKEIFTKTVKHIQEISR